MVVPNLIHPVWATIQKADRTTTAYDEDAREPIRSVDRATVRVQAQVRYRSLSDPDWLAIGPAENAKGYLLFRHLDLSRLGYTPKRGDRVTKLGKRVVEYYFLDEDPAGHYPDQDGYTLLKVYFEDRRPSALEPAM